MYLYCGLSDANIAGDLLIEATGCDLNHDLSLARAERFKTLPEGIQGPITFATRTIASEARLHRIEEILIPERFCEELYCPALHRLYGHRDVPVRRDEDDRHFPVCRGKVSLQLKAASPWHSNVEHEATRTIPRIGIQKVGNGRKLLCVQADRPQQTPNRVAKLGIIIDDQDVRLRVMHP